MNDYSFTFAGAGEDQRDIQAATHVRIVDATAAVYIALNNGPYLKRAKGWAQSIEAGRPITKIAVKSLVAQTVLIAAGRGSTDDATTINATLSATVAPANTLGAGGDVALAAGVATLIAAADATRRALLVVNPATNGAAVRVGGAGVGAAAGVPVEPGESVTLATTAAVWGYSAGVQSVCALPLREV